MSDSDSKPEPSELVKASPYLTTLWTGGYLPPEEIERRARGAQRLKEAFSSIPFHARKAAKDPDYWHHFYVSRVNS